MVCATRISTKRFAASVVVVFCWSRPYMTQALKIPPTNSPVHKCLLCTDGRGGGSCLASSSPYEVAVPASSVVYDLAASTSYCIFGTSHLPHILSEVLAAGGVSCGAGVLLNAELVVGEGDHHVYARVAFCKDRCNRT
ncbi:hypothetical protein E2C01_020202 [Portunus trituberculatus]|uniref:Uncharacterized protein n=1 Tax=Portunus trituberculatus TaxID=210409 RepID=A0A5B7E0W4_PORTR|nr:hypothetical protein [Portunus trituberculatus]